MCTHVKKVTSYLIQIVVQIEYGSNGVSDHVNIFFEYQFQEVRTHSSRRLCYIS